MAAMMERGGVVRLNDRQKPYWICASHYDSDQDCEDSGEEKDIDSQQCVEPAEEESEDSSSEESQPEDNPGLKLPRSLWGRRKRH